MFGICSMSGVENLIARIPSREINIKYYATNDEMFDILHIWLLDMAINIVWKGNIK